MPGLQAGLKVDFSGYCGFYGDSVFAWFLVLTVEVGKVNLLWPHKRGQTPFVREVSLRANSANRFERRAEFAFWLFSPVDRGGREKLI